MKITIESATPHMTRHVAYNERCYTVEDAIRLCESALSAHFGYGIQIADWVTYGPGDDDA